MVKLSDLFHESTVDVSEIGRIKLREASTGSLRTALEASETIPEHSAPIAFSNHLLSLMTVEPILSAEDIAQLGEEQIRPIAFEAAKLQDAVDFVDWSDNSTDARTHLYNAIEAQQKMFYAEVVKPAMESLAKSPAMIALNSNFASSLLSPLNTYTESIAKIQLPAIQADMTSALRYIDTLKMQSAMSQALSASVLGVSQSFLDATRIDLGGDIVAACSALSVLPNNIAELARGSLTSVASALTSEMSILPSIVETIGSQVKFPNSLIARGLIYSGVDNPGIHSPGYIEPDFIVIEKEVDGCEAEEHEAKQRRLRCQDAFFELELKLRDTVQNALEQVGGDRWWKQRVSKGIRDNCAKKKIAREFGTAPQLEPIHYSDFGELKDIIRQGNNWNQAFEPIFRNDTVLTAMFQLVATVRNDLDHSRTPNNQDYIRFMTAVNWFYEMLGLREPFELSEVVQ